MATVAITLRVPLTIKYRGNEDFTEKQYSHIHQMFQLTDDALNQMVSLVEDEGHQVDVNKSF